MISTSKPLLLIALICTASFNGSNASNLRKLKQEDKDTSKTLSGFYHQALRAKETLSHGIYFSRKTTDIPDGASFSVDVSGGSKLCSVHDDKGYNDCTFPWDEPVDVTIKSSLGVDLDEGDTLTGKVTVDIFAHLSFTCNVCGDPCTVTIPKVNYDLQLEVPPCPISGTDFSYRIKKTLPTPGFLPPTFTDGKFKIIKADGTQVAEASVKINVEK